MTEQESHDAVLLAENVGTVWKVSASIVPAPGMHPLYESRTVDAESPAAARAYMRALVARLMPGARVAWVSVSIPFHYLKRNQPA